MPTVSGVVVDSAGNQAPWSVDFDVATPPVVSSWQEAFDTRDMRGTQPARDPVEPVGAIRAWYEANTGHDPTHDYETLPAGTWTINAAWLNARLGNGRVSFTDGRWHVERYALAGMIRFAADNVTLTNIHQNGMPLYGIQSRALDGPAVGCVIERSTLCGNWNDFTSMAINFPANAAAPDQFTIRHCDISGYRGGLYAFHGITAEYNWVHDLHFTATSHNSAGGMRGGNNRFYRNLMADGNSACLTWYAEQAPYTNNRAEQNIFRLAAGDNGAETIMTDGVEKIYWNPEPGQTRELIGNLFYRGGNRGEGGGIGGAVAPIGFTRVEGNVDRMGEPVTL